MTTSPFRVVLDTCVLFPQNLANLLLSIADAGLFSPVWSGDIMAELERNLVSKAGLTNASAGHRLNQMQRAFPQAMVTGYEPLLPVLTNHPKDRHVLAAAMRSGAAQIVTANLKDFPPTAMADFEIEAIHPNEFLLNQLDLDEERTLAAIDAMLARNQRPPTDRYALVSALQTQVPDFCAELTALTRPVVDPVAVTDQMPPRFDDPTHPLGFASLWWAALLSMETYPNAVAQLTGRPESWDFPEALRQLSGFGIASMPHSDGTDEGTRYIKLVPEYDENVQAFAAFPVDRIRVLELHRSGEHWVAAKLWIDEWPPTALREPDAE